MRGVLIIGWVVLMTVLGSMPGHAERRVALVIGNGAYQHLRSLANPPNDARDLTRVLEALGFEVDLGVDLSLVEMQRKITGFAKRAGTADVALAFFAGHGVQAPDPSGSARPANYLLPIDADIKDAADLDYVPTAQNIVSGLQSSRGARILILDACRDNPIPQFLSHGRSAGAARGLAPPAQTSGAYIAFSTQPDQIAGDGDTRNSPFAAALLRHISEPGLELRSLFTDVRDDVKRASQGAQIPETWDSLSGRFYFKEAAPASSPPAKPTQSAAPSPQPPTPQAALPKPAEAQVALASPHVLPPRVLSPCGPGAATVSFSSRCAAPLAAAEERMLKPKDVFKECPQCPEMAVLPQGSFTMGSPEGEVGHSSVEGPQHTVTIGKPFAVGKFQVTVDQFAAFAEATHYDAGSKCRTLEDSGKYEERSDRSWRNPGFANDGSHPAVCINWSDAKAYVDWLAKTTGKPYRLLTEAEWEYAARGRTEPGSYPPFYFGYNENDMCRFANTADETARAQIPGINWVVVPCSDGYAYTSPVGSFAANPFGLYDMHGNAWQWTEDCYHSSYKGAPADGSAWLNGDCRFRVLRGGSWYYAASSTRAASRLNLIYNYRYHSGGFRVARNLAP